MKQFLDRDWLFDSYVKEGLSQEKIADLCSVNQTTIRYHLLRLGIPCRKVGSRKGELCGKWKGGRFKTSQGYIHVLSHGHPLTMPSKPYVPEQVLVVEKSLGRFLQKGEAVHHINEIKDDNRVENLYLFPSESSHQSYHRLLHFGKVEPIITSNLLSRSE
ncbi:MAG: hypothetical protein UT24_C0020G0004 [Candidatus Woesebacteria bacterium GW2011_GWB1_39_12]|uniref:HNH nuclease domain-containing protein n=1 Tax=Candidatus Woesebacteria bacterium GW2011_GWB1_39_12 TaxID=1618574 RepID=A0A0G0QDZ5_9BACT|nr:MAG: hypothetical protein UT24_C0020G0004 [Candidatus Woesebacteria bacterium GW2011_GWB1_39_12]